MPLAIEQLDLRGYDLVISNSHAVAKGVITGPDQLHLCYCYSPPRYAWDMQDLYLGRGGWIRKYLLHRFRLWDVAAGQRPDLFFAISHFIAGRIEKCYRRAAEVLYPPLDTAWFTPGGERASHYFTHSRLVPYKRIDILVEAFRALPEQELRIAGEGPERARLERAAPGNVRFLGHLADEALREELRTARAFLFAAEEDFGLAPLEAQACGTPVIAYGRGGVWETLGQAPGCSFFTAQEPASIAIAVRAFELAPSLPEAQVCRENVLRFSEEQFRGAFRREVEVAWQAWRSRTQGNRLP
jgi:glycosyltransferase involved in cell wall biosynthesis